MIAKEILHHQLDVMQNMVFTNDTVYDVPIITTYRYRRKLTSAVCTRYAAKMRNVVNDGLFWDYLRIFYDVQFCLRSVVNSAAFGEYGANVLTPVFKHKVDRRLRKALCYPYLMGYSDAVEIVEFIPTLLTDSVKDVRLTFSIHNRVGVMSSFWLQSKLPNLRITNNRVVIGNEFASVRTLVDNFKDDVVFYKLNAFMHNLLYKMWHDRKHV